jgi:ribonuclease HI
MENSVIRVYTDGSASIKNGKGGIAVYIVDGEKETFYQKGFYNTKTGRCEVRALLTALQLIEDKSRRVVIYSDSQYVVNSIEAKWAFRWEMEKWFERSNSDLWKQILVEYRKFPSGNVRLKHLRGHQKDLSNIHVLGNNIADVLADYKQFDEFEEDKKL